jgi:hypothetical protein
MKALQRIQKSFEKRAGFKEGHNPFQNSEKRAPKESTATAPLKSNER